ncbi:MAG TPA: hypothetical protein VN682_24875 [Terriglobales bacterium]|nr:hypothetical protein [Terriglobales bacterium]
MSDFSITTKVKMLWLAAVVFSLTMTLSSQTPPPSPNRQHAPPDINLILRSMEAVEQRNPAHSHSFEVTRNYQVFRADDKQPTSEITAEISFIPPDVESYKITQASGNPRGVKIVDAILAREMESAAEGAHASIGRMNYDFTFLRQEDFGLVPEYVLLLIPKRKEKDLLRGQIWVDANTFHIRRIEGVPAKNPSWWIKDVHITLQFATVDEMWMPVSFDAIATVRLLGQFTLAGLTVRPHTPQRLAKVN